MPMTVVVTTNAPGRTRGFLASCMCEIAPGVYTAPRMSAGVRDRVWSVIESWWTPRGDASLVMTWPDSSLPGGQQVRTAGVPRKDVISHYGVFLARGDLSNEEQSMLAKETSEIPLIEI